MTVQFIFTVLFILVSHGMEPSSEPVETKLPSGDYVIVEAFGFVEHVDLGREVHIGKNDKSLLQLILQKFEKVEQKKILISTRIMNGKNTLFVGNNSILDTIVYEEGNPQLVIWEMGEAEKSFVVLAKKGANLSTLLNSKEWLNKVKELNHNLTHYDGWTHKFMHEDPDIVNETNGVLEDNQFQENLVFTYLPIAMINQILACQLAIAIDDLQFETWYFNLVNGRTDVIKRWMMSSELPKMILRVDNRYKTASDNDNEACQLQFLLENGADVNAKDKYGRTPLSRSIYPKKREKFFDIFIKDDNVDVNLANFFGLAPLHFAAQIGNEEQLRALLERGANVNAQTRDGRITPLMSAIIAGKTNCAKMILRKHPNQNLRLDLESSDGTALDIATKMQNHEIIKIIQSTMESRKNLSQIHKFVGGKGKDMEATCYKIQI